MSALSCLARHQLRYSIGLPKKSLCGNKSVHTDKSEASRWIGIHLPKHTGSAPQPNSSLFHLQSNCLRFLFLSQQWGYTYSPKSFSRKYLGGVLEATARIIGKLRCVALNPGASSSVYRFCLVSPTETGQQESVVLLSQPSESSSSTQAAGSYQKFPTTNLQEIIYAPLCY